MQYLLMIYMDESTWTKMPESERNQWMGAYRSFIEALTKGGVLRATTRLQNSSTATTVRVVDGKTQVLDGPYADSKEQLGGIYLIDVSDLDAALSWASRCPGASHGLVEVRPIMAIPS